MQIYLKNEIDMDGQIEYIEQVFPVEVVEKGKHLYLHFQNEESEKVLLKCEQTEMTMTRYATPKSVMRFVLNQEALVTIPTPLGLQQLVTVTHEYQLLREKGLLYVTYDLQSAHQGQRFASYRLCIQWK